MEKIFPEIRLFFLQSDKYLFGRSFYDLISDHFSSIASAVIPLVAYPSIEEAEDAGARLMDNGIAADVRGTTLFVGQPNVDRAKQLLDLPTEAPPKKQKAFHPCPSCGAGDPSWYGKRKAMLIAAAFLVSAWLAFQKSPALWPVTLIAFAAVVISFWFIPEYQCRQCRRRFSG